MKWRLVCLTVRDPLLVGSSLMVSMLMAIDSVHSKSIAHGDLTGVSKTLASRSI